MSKKYEPIDVDKLDQVFGGKAMEILPKWGDIPDEFWRSGNPWAKWARDWFFDGFKAMPVPKEGIDLKKAMSNLECCQRSFMPKHEHKEAGVAYLASLWFSSPGETPDT